MGDHIDLMIKESESIAAGLAAAVIAIPENVAHTAMVLPRALRKTKRWSSGGVHSKFGIRR